MPGRPWQAPPTGRRVSVDEDEPPDSATRSLQEKLASVRSASERLEEELNEGREARSETERSLGEVRAADRRAAPFETHGYPVSGALRGARILVVEDDPDTGEALAALFRERGARVETAATAQEALERLQRAPVDLIVSDIRLPDAPGHNLIRTIRAWSREHGGHTPALAVTGYATALDHQTAIAAGFNAYLRKPAGHEIVPVAAGLLASSRR